MAVYFANVENADLMQRGGSGGKEGGLVKRAGNRPQGQGIPRRTMHVRVNRF